MQIASLISTLTEPMVLVMFLMGVGAWQAGLRDSALVSFLIYIGVFSLASLILRRLAMKRLDVNWDISDRSKRVKSLIPFLGICAVFFSVIFMWGNNALSDFGISLIVWLAGFSLITLRTKISGHMAVYMLTFGYMIIWFGAVWWLFLLALPLVAWSRLVLKRHTLYEVIGGTLYSIFFLLIFMQFFER